MQLQPLVASSPRFSNKTPLTGSNNNSFGASVPQLLSHIQGIEYNRKIHNNFQIRESCELFNVIPDLIRIISQIKLSIQYLYEEELQRIDLLESALTQIESNVNKLNKNHRKLENKMQTMQQ
ncbi:Hypothetical_protein [Hexamita inflata]|uniref:Hypothetical_protein n=1 Tax=Hexamita inflata TaxID=28002 RepID=A0ABP1HMP2_9EUKA